MKFVKLCVIICVFLISFEEMNSREQTISTVMLLRNEKTLKGKEKMMKVQRRNFQNKKDDSGLSKGFNSAKLAAACFKGLAENIPPSFCWKRGGDFGIIPTMCPKGYFRSLALCYENCKDGYDFILGVCYKKCEVGYTNHGLSCYKNLFRWYFKSAYIPNSLTNFSEQILCPKDMYHAGALCYRDCKIINMENCGIGACSLTKESCTSEITTMVAKTVQGIADAILLVVSFGTSSGFTTAKNAISQGIKNLGNGAIKASLNAVKKALTGNFKDGIIKQATKATKEFVEKKAGEIFESHVQNFAVESFCKHVISMKIADLSKTKEIAQEVLIKAVDVFSIKGIVDDCKGSLGEEGAIKCAKSVLESGSVLDPSGVLTIASAFMHPICKDNSPKTPEELEAVKVQELLDEVGDNCIALFDECNFTGEKKIFCDKDIDLLNEFNDRTSSLLTGKKAHGIIYEHGYYQGRYLPFGPSTVIKCLKEYKQEEYSLDNLLSSVKFNGDVCVIINFKTVANEKNDQSKNYQICSDTPKIDYQISKNLIYLRTSIYEKGVNAILYEGENYTGKSWVIKEDKFYEDKDIPFRVIKSAKYKVKLRK